MARDYPSELSAQDIKQTYPDLKPGVVMVVIGDRIYERSGDRWYLLDNRLPLEK